ncbi:MAG: NAD(+)/NADH kinase [Spirochaetota bacterium]
MVRLVGIVLKYKSKRADKSSSVLIKYLESREIDYFTLYAKPGHIHRSINDKIPNCGLSVTFGGDGTLLFAARLFSIYGIPIVGINLGGLGFITEFKESEVVECVDGFIRGLHSFEERMMVDVRVLRGKEVVFTATGLNDLVVTSRDMSRLLKLEVSTEKKFIGTYRADGIIVATPTGSTAYSLSAGGPILEPTMKAFAISPICPHSLGARPLVVPADEGIKIKVLSKNRNIKATVDGQVAFEVLETDEVEVLKSKTVTRLVSLGKRSFYDIVREKLAWRK